MRKPLVLVVDDDDFVTGTLEILLRESYEVVKAQSSRRSLWRVQAG
ncbi:MAG: hypothetical protein HS130_08440 [Deltaproteobacteria bacterium]|nr:hypothetical protein [Deltaproteobacteria bacterium]